MFEWSKFDTIAKISLENAYLRFCVRRIKKKIEFFLWVVDFATNEHLRGVCKRNTIDLVTSGCVELFLGR